jgi:hypothetical protein
MSSAMSWQRILMGFNQGILTISKHFGMTTLKSDFSGQA